MVTDRKYDFKYNPTKEYIYWVYDANGDGFSFFKTEEERDEYATNEIFPSYLDGGFWYSDIESCIFGGVLTHQASKTNIQTPVGEIDEDGYDEDGEYWEDDMKFRCNYELKEIDNE
jgi:hypothetical protein